MDEDKAVKFLRCPSSDLVELAIQKANLTWKEELAITLCVRRDMTQERAAEYSNLSPDTIQRWYRRGISKLADLYTIRDQMDRAKAAKKSPEPQPKVSMSAPDPALFDGDSEFMRAIKGKDSAAVWAVIDDLMDTLHVTMPRAYNGVMRRIKDL